MKCVGSIEMIVRLEGERVLLCSPGVGLFSGALPESSAMVAGQGAGVLITLERRAQLIVPDGVQGIVRSKPPARLRDPVQYGQVLYEVSAMESVSQATPRANGPRAELNGELLLRSPQSGRFYHRTAPGEPTLCEVGRELEIGTPVGLIEVMKTFTQDEASPFRPPPSGT